MVADRSETGYGTGTAEDAEAKTNIHENLLIEVPCSFYNLSTYLFCKEKV